MRPSIGAPRDCCAYCGLWISAPIVGRLWAGAPIVLGRYAGPIVDRLEGKTEGYAYVLRAWKTKNAPIARGKRAKFIAKKRSDSGDHRQSDHF